MNTGDVDLNQCTVDLLEGQKRTADAVLTVLRSPGHRREIAQEMAERYRQGRTFLQIANDLGVSRTTARSLVIEGGARPRPRGRPPLPRPTHPMLFDLT